MRRRALGRRTRRVRGGWRRKSDIEGEQARCARATSATLLRRPVPSHCAIVESGNDLDLDANMMLLRGRGAQHRRCISCGPQV